MVLPGVISIGTCQSLFENCENLKEGPLMNFYLYSYAMRYAFKNCVELETVPDMSIRFALTSDASCYQMFYNCKKLKNFNIGELKLDSNLVAASMFEGCETLTLPPVKVLNATFGNYPCEDMYKNCKNLKEIPTLLSSSYHSFNNMFAGCTSLESVELDLRSSTWGYNGYSYMFSGCSNLKYIKCLTVDTGINPFLWLIGVSATGTFVKHPDATWATGSSGIPEGWTIEDAEI